MNAVVRPRSLRDPDSWRYHVDDAGREDRNVILSWCGCYTVVRYPHIGALVAFRRFGTAAERTWSPPLVLGSAMDITAAVEICAQHSESEGST